MRGVFSGHVLLLSDGYDVLGREDDPAAKLPCLGMDGLILSFLFE
jgi:hypothetical protein